MKNYRKIYVNINSRCNCKCVNCILKEENRVDVNILQLEDMLSLVNEIRSVYNDGHLNILEISGGEPTLHHLFWDFLKIVRGAKIEGLVYKVILLTNGITSANLAFCSNIAEYIDDVVITLYDTNAKVHDSFTQVSGSFVKKCKAIDNYIELGVKIHIKLLVIKPSYMHLPQMTKFIVDRWGGDVHVAINGTHFTGDAYKNLNSLSFNYIEAIEYVEQAMDVLIENDITFSIFFPLCFIDPIYWKYSPWGFKKLIDDSISIAPTYELGKANRLLDEFINRSEVCQDCKLISRCNWPWKKYTEIIGDKEIRAAKKNLYDNVLV